jgi:menaquinone-dependent protoporphyrinogen oxidase
MASVLILYSTTDGQTLAICRRLQSVLEQAAHRVTLKCVDEDPAVDLSPFDKVVLGARIRYGRHTPQVLRFAQAQREALDARPNAFFSVNAVARKAEKATPEANPYMRRFLAESPWRPKALAVFAGRIDYPRYGFVDRQVIRFIMWLTRGPTDPRTTVEFTDWAAVERFGAGVARM